MKNLLNNWNMVRVLRLGVGAWGMYIGIKDGSVLLILLSVFLLVLAFLNTPCCCGGSSCSINPPSKKSEETPSQDTLPNG